MLQKRLGKKLKKVEIKMAEKVEHLRSKVYYNKTGKDWFQDCCKFWSLKLGFCFMVVKKYRNIQKNRQAGGAGRQAGG